MTKPTWPEPVPHPHTKRPERTYDTSSLRAASHGTYVHRDYAAHWFRWAYALRFVQAGMRVLDLGCGQDQAMTRVLCARQACVPERYVGVDVDRLKRKSQIAWATIYDEFDVTKRWRELQKAYTAFDVITCFEVIEHMPVAAGRQLLRAAKALLRANLTPAAKGGGTFLLSTPVYNEKHMAANHLHEYRYEELEGEILAAGFVVERVHGTFMTSQAIKRVAAPAEKALVAELHGYYPWEVLANFLAPKYPRASSNCCWVLRHP